MARERIYAKFKGAMNPDGTPSEFVNGVPAHDLMESEFHALPDEAKAVVLASPLYDLRHDAPDEAEAASKRVARSDAPPMTGSVVVPDPAPTPEAPAEDAAPRGGGKK